MVAQRVMCTLCSACKEAYKPDHKELEHMIEQYGREAFPELGIKPDEVELYSAQAVKDGMRTLKQDGIAKIFAGLSDYTQLLNVTAE